MKAMTTSWTSVMVTKVAQKGNVTSGPLTVVWLMLAKIHDYMQYIIQHP